MKNTQKGITLIALIITVIVLLILAGTAVSIAISGDNIFDRTTQAKESWNQKVGEENTIINNYVEQLNQYFENNPSGGNTPQTGVTIPSELATKVSNNEDLTAITILLPTVSGSYEWNPEYYSDLDDMTQIYDSDWTADTKYLYTGTNAQTEGASTLGSAANTSKYDMTITGWKILKVNNDNTIDLIPVNPSKPNVPLGGAQGYNNGVNLLNAACSALYGDESKGIYARSIKIEDLEALADETALSTAKASIGTQASIPFTGEKAAYASIYAEEKGAVINGVTAAKGLGQSELRSNFIERASNIVSNAQSIQPINSEYNFLIDSTNFGNYADIITPPENENKPFGFDNYWIATRCVSVSNSSDSQHNYYWFGLYHAADDEYYDSSIFMESMGCRESYSMYNEYDEKFITLGIWNSLYPVVTLKSGSLTGSGNSYTFVPAT